MTTFTLDTDNNITAHDAPPAAQDNMVAFATEKELSKLSADWPITRFVEVWNAFAGAPPFGDLKPVKKFTDRKTAVARIWKAIQTLGEELMRASIRDAEAKLKAARTAPNPTQRAVPVAPRKAKAAQGATAKDMTHTSAMSLVATAAAHIAFMALSLLGLSALRWEPTSTMGTGVSIMKESAAAVYIMVSVPWVIIMPSAPFFISSYTARASSTQ